MSSKAKSVKSYLLDALLDSTPDHVYFKDLDSRFIAISRSLSRWIGLEDPSEVIGRTDFDYFTEEHARQGVRRRAEDYPDR